MKLTLSIARIIVGLLFIFSGLIKANDPLGLSYKMQEFFEIWGWHTLNDYTLALSILMIAFEIIAGVAVLLGWQFNLFSWLLLLLIIFFTFLTGYALFSGKVRECGCFGDCIKLTAKDSFVKDVVLLGLILVIFAFRKKILPLFSSRFSLLILLITVIFSFAIQFYVLKHLPIVDCLAYKKGNNIPEKMKIPPGAIPDSTVINFVYQKEGKPVEFDADHFPADFNDSIYQFVKRYDKVVRKGNAEPSIKDFILTSRDGIDSTQIILTRPGYTVLYFSMDKGEEPKELRSENDLPSVLNSAKSKGFGVYAVSNNADKLAERFNKLDWPYSIMKCDVVAIKTAARVNPTIYLLKQGTVIDKWGLSDFDKALHVISTL
jgi:uncharacterized membrane protein YphA (DoxX/SURF4 family)